jgi:uncharacterized protein
MNKIQVDILGLSVNPQSNHAYALVLKELDGVRRLPIVIGEPEAQSIANELEGVKPQRPMTHDLLRNVIEGLGASLKEIVITSLREGTFYATLVFDYSDIEIDARPSDAVALAIRCGANMYVTEDIMNEAAYKHENDGDTADDEQEDEFPSSTTSEENQEPPVENLSYRERLARELKDAIGNEDYEAAARIRDELQRLEE